MYILTSGRSPLGMGIEIRRMLALFGYDDSGVPVHRRDHSVNAAQFTQTIGPSRRSLLKCTARATNSLPTPLSPRINTVASVGA